jgi:polysaccharide deacetylase family protein (PEP-CTERM system associated)
MLSQTPLPACPSSAHIFSVDVEDYFQVVAFERVVDRATWGRYPSRVEANTDRLLELLDQRRVRGTFFTLGWVAVRYPALVRRIAGQGHEVASHGYWHRRVSTLTPDEFRKDVREARLALEDASGQPCVGFRAPSFSIVPGHEWAFDVLVEEGYRYDSSLFPIRRPDYGFPDSLDVPYVITRPGGDLLELPMATMRLAGPISGSCPTGWCSGRSVSGVTAGYPRCSTSTPGNTMPSSPGWPAAASPLSATIETSTAPGPAWSAS